MHRDKRGGCRSFSMSHSTPSRFLNGSTGNSVYSRAHAFYYTRRIVCPVTKYCCNSMKSEISLSLKHTIKIQSGERNTIRESLLYKREAYVYTIYLDMAYYRLIHQSFLYDKSGDIAWSRAKVVLITKPSGRTTSPRLPKSGRGGYQKIQSLILIINHLLIGKKRYASSHEIT